MKNQINHQHSNVFTLSAVALATLLALGTGMRAYAVEKTAAQTVAPTVATAPANKPEADAMLRFSQAGRTAIDNIKVARIHLNDGKTDLAMGELKEAQSALMTAKAEAPTFVDQTKVMVQGKQVGQESAKVTADLVPVGSDIVLADNFKLSEKHRPFLSKAKDFLSRGNQKSAVETLKQGEIDIAVSRVWMPLSNTERQLDKAISLAAKKDYYNANLALKAIEDGLQVDIASYDLAPAHGHHS